MAKMKQETFDLALNGFDLNNKAQFLFIQEHFLDRYNATTKQVADKLRLFCAEATMGGNLTTDYGVRVKDGLSASLFENINLVFKNENEDERIVSILIQEQNWNGIKDLLSKPEKDFLELFDEFCQQNEGRHYLSSNSEKKREFADIKHRVGYLLRSMNFDGFETYCSIENNNFLMSAIAVTPAGEQNARKTFINLAVMAP
jgi:hypothetical protein